MTELYTTTQEYLDDYFALLALRLHREVALARLLRGDAKTNEAFLGLFLSDEEMDSILADLHGVVVPHGDNGDEEDDKRLVAEIETMATTIAERIATTSSDQLRPQRLVALLGLPPQATELLLMLLATEVDHRFSRVYAYLQDDVSRRWLSPGLALRLLPGTDPDDPVGRALFTPESPLRQAQVIHLGQQDCQALPVPLIDCALKLDCGIVEYLLARDVLDPHLVGIVERKRPFSSLNELPLETSVSHQLHNLQTLWQAEIDPAPAAFFWGRSGSGKVDAALALAAALERPLLLVSGQALSLKPAELPGLWQRVRRQALLDEALICVQGVEAVGENGRLQLFENLTGGIILIASEKWAFHTTDRPPLMVAFDDAGHALRQRVWQQALNTYTALNGQTGQVAAELAERFRLTPGQIQQAATAAQHAAWLRAGPQTPPSRADLFQGCRDQSNPQLARLAVKVTTPYTWDDLVLPPAQSSLLQAIESQVRHSHTVYRQWGFDGKVAYAEGLNALFSGPSGTGKTMAAGILAQSLGLDMYKIDLSGVVSKYIGETEKNLDRIFVEASTANAVLFFDEADALFGKRSEVKDAHDRYANIEISYLLQKMEEYDGVAILATNLSQNLDEAFTRRMQFVVEFPLPHAEDRKRIWRGLLPVSAPRRDDIDFDFLANQFELTGGNIKNCVLSAAFLAAEDGGVIAMMHMIQGVARELGKLGRPLTRSHFGEYYRMVRQN
ncbi:MAG: ATP-binding protein [Anaerolineales bacterium]|nr:ATP-binding protein [Anaerolineales bacterium]